MILKPKIIDSYKFYGKILLTGYGLLFLFYFIFAIFICTFILVDNGVAVLLNIDPVVLYLAWVIFFSVLVIVCIPISWKLILGRVCAKVLPLRNDIAKSRRVIVDGCANEVSRYKSKIKKMQFRAWLFLTDSALEYYPFKKEKISEPMAILLDDINAVENHGLQRLCVYTSQGVYEFNLYQADIWAQSIKQTVGIV